MNRLNQKLSPLLRVSLLVLAYVTSGYSVGTSIDKAPDGAGLFKNNCAHCHNGSVPKAPQKIALIFMSPGKIYDVITDGPMKMMAQHLSEAERKAIAESITGQKLSDVSSEFPKRQCAANKQWFDYSRHPLANGWGISGPDNTRFIPAETAGLSPKQVSKLKLKWAFSFPSASAARSQPAIAGNALFVGSQDGTVYALDADSGCVHWTFKSKAEVRTAISIGPWQGDQSRAPDQAPNLYFGDRAANAYAINAMTGELRWQTKVDDHATAVVTGTPTFHQTDEGPRLYVPVGSIEDGFTYNPKYPCCTMRGSVAALDAETGEVVWKTYAVPDAPTLLGVNANGTEEYGPAGAGIWASPTLDTRRQRIYVGTGESKSSVATGYSNSVIAINTDDGSIAWVMRSTIGEPYNARCQGKGIGCPKGFRQRKGMDFAASPMLITGEDGKDIIVAGEKTGEIFGLDPDDEGRVLWRRVISRGEFNRGVLFGMAAEQRTVFATVYDLYRDPLKGGYPGIEELGIYALDAFTGDRRWTAPVADACEQAYCRGYGAALTAIPGVVFAGSKDGYFRAYNTTTGKLLWQYNTVREYVTLSGGKGRGGDIDGPGAVVVNGVVYVNSGYAAGNSSKQPGNVLLAFSPDGK